MKPSRKDINKLFDVDGADGSWIYQLIAVSKTELLFYCFGSDRYEIEDRKHNDWRLFVPQPYSKRDIKYGWENGRRARN